MSFKRLDPQDFLISADSVVGGMWTGGGSTQTEFYTSSTQETANSGDYYLDVYQTGSTLTNAEVQFAVSYGDKFGSGSAQFDSNIKGKSPSSVVYGQIQNIVLGDETNNFIFSSGTPTKQHIYVLTFDRARYKGNIFPGTLNLTLTKGSGVLNLTDNSKDVSVDTFNEAGRVYQLVSGSDGRASDEGVSGQVAAGMTSVGSYGLVLPDVGMIVLNASALDLTAGSNGGLNLATGTSADADDANPKKLVNAIVDGASFQINSQENLTSDYVFIRARNGEFNYSENPSFISGSTGEVLYTSFVNAPQTFVTSIGLYNDNNELLAVAKLSKPLKKDFTKEALVRVKLDF